MLLERAQAGPPRKILKDRRQEVLARLALSGLMRGPRRLSTEESARGGARARIVALREALEDLGPVFAAFGRYLASRIDLLSIQDCLTLSAIPDRAPRTPYRDVRSLIAREIGRTPEEAFLSFQEEPFESRLLVQSHRAFLGDGAAVTVKIVHTEAEERLVDLNLLRLLREALEGVGIETPGVDSAIQDFRISVRQEIDLTQEAKALEILRLDAEQFETARIPAVHREFCTPNMLAVECLSGITLEAALPNFEAAKHGYGSPVHSGGVVADRRDVARLLSVVWLRQALLGQAYPGELRPRDIVIVSSRQIAFTGGPFASLPAGRQPNLSNYLLAVSAENPDQACSTLLDEMKSESRPVDEQELRQRFRQVVPFRDGDWNTGDHNWLAEYLFVQWRLASERGCVPQAHLPPFYRGLFALASLMRQLVPEEDVLRSALREVRLISGMAMFRELMDDRRLGDHIDKYLSMMVDLPQKLDRMLSTAAEGGPRVRLRVEEPPARRRRKNSTAMSITVMLLLAAIALWSHHVAASLGSAAWADRIGAGAFVVLGAILLWMAGRV